MLKPYPFSVLLFLGLAFHSNSLGKTKDAKVVTLKITFIYGVAAHLNLPIAALSQLVFIDIGHSVGFLGSTYLANL